MNGIMIVVLCSMVALQCGGGRSLSQEEMAKLDPHLQRLLTETSPSDTDYDVSVRGDGVKEYGVIVRSDRPQELRDAGIKVGSVFGDVVTARVSLDELRQIVGLASVRAVEQGSRNQVH